MNTALILCSVGDFFYDIFAFIFRAVIILGCLFVIYIMFAIFKKMGDDQKRARKEQERMNRFWDDLENGGNIEIHLEPRDDDDDGNSAARPRRSGRNRR